MDTEAVKYKYKEIINKVYKKRFFRNKFSFNYKILFIILLICISIALFLINSSHTTIFPSKIEITEVMSSNNGVICDEDGDLSDWIELHNNSNKTINLKDLGLSDDEKEPRKWVFPSISIKPNEYLTIFASGKNRNKPEGELHTNFKLSSKGETIILSNSTYIIDKIDIVELSSGISYGKNSENKKWNLFSTSTPGFENPLKGYDTTIDCSGTIIEPSNLFINEFMSSDQRVIYDEDGDFSDWIEIYNSSDETLSLKDYFLTDNSNEPMKWTFPDVTINAKEYLLVFASAKDRKDTSNTYLHTNFKLSSSSESIMLYNSEGILIDNINSSYLPKGVSMGRKPDSPSAWSYFSRPTPGKENYKYSFDKIDDAEQKIVKGIWLNELAAINSSILKDGDGQYSDWFELYNYNDETISLNGYGLSDDVSNLFKYTFGQKNMSPNSYLIVFASGKNKVDRKKYIHTNFKLSTSETLYLSDPDGYIIDTIDIGKTNNKISIGKINDKKDRYYFNKPTPGKVNDSITYQGYAAPPIFSINGGLYKDKVEVSLSNVSKNGQIYYTTDGNIPNSSSKKYTHPLTLEKNTVIRAIAYEDDFLPSAVMTETFFINTEHDLPTVSISTNSSNLFDRNKGIYINYMSDIEVPIHFELFEPDNHGGISFDAGMKIFGRVSRTAPQKAFAIFMKDNYGVEEIYYPLFPDEINGINTFRSFVLRASGNDWNMTHILDGMIFNAIKDEVNVDTMSFRPAVLYINGEYWGIYNFRDKLNADYIETHHGVDADNIDLLESNSIICQGSNKEYYKLLSYVRNHDLRKTEYYEHVKTMMDIDSFIDHVIIGIYFDNYDSGNLKYWREKSEDGKWRWMTFDLDWSCHYPSRNTILLRTDPEGHGTRKVYDTTLICNLLKNKEFKNQFAERFAELMNTVFQPDYLLEQLNKTQTLIENEMPNQLERWHVSNSIWQENLKRVRTFFKTRPTYMKKYIQRFFRLSNSEMKRMFK